MKVLYLINKTAGPLIEDVKEGKGHDSWLFGMLRLPKHGIETDFLEIEKFIPEKFAKFLRKHVLTMHYAHLPLFPLFFRYDIVFTSTAYSGLILKAILRIKKFKWVVLDFNILGTIGEKKTIKQKLYAYGISKADGIVTISEAARDALRERFPHLKEKIVFIHEATDTEYFSPDVEVKEKDIVLSVGNFGRDFDVVMDATEGLGVTCRIATKLISKEEAKRLPEHVSVKLYSHDEMLEAYQESKIAFIGIEYEDKYTDSVGTFAVIEALSMGKAVIATDTKSVHSYIKDGENGILVPQFDADTLRSEISKLLTDEEKRKELGESAREFAKKNLEAEVFAEKLSAYFKIHFDKHE